MWYSAVGRLSRRSVVVGGFSVRINSAIARYRITRIRVGGVRDLDCYDVVVVFGVVFTDATVRGGGGGIVVKVDGASAGGRKRR